ncbi:mobile element protein [Streptomyces sp. NL15-2K]|nr:mobile element protein [Streptomyces sp. NL15-2K]
MPLREVFEVSTTGTGALLVPYPAAFDLPHALVEWVTMLIVTREGDWHRSRLHHRDDQPARRPCTGPAQGAARDRSQLRPP